MGSRHSHIRSTLKDGTGFGRRPTASGSQIPSLMGGLDSIQFGETIRNIGKTQLAEFRR